MRWVIRRDVPKTPKLTLTSMSPILLTARMMGRPTIEGNICAGKLLPFFVGLKFNYYVNYNQMNWFIEFWWIVCYTCVTALDELQRKNGKLVNRSNIFGGLCKTTPPMQSHFPQWVTWEKTTLFRSKLTISSEIWLHPMQKGVVPVIIFIIAVENYLPRFHYHRQLHFCPCCPWFCFLRLTRVELHLPFVLNRFPRSSPTTGR